VHLLTGVYSITCSVAVPCLQYLLHFACVVINILMWICIKAIPVTDRGGPQGCETSRLSYFLDNRLTDGGEVVSLTRRRPITPQEDFWYSFLLEAESTPGS
jgi:hypothetical protein